MNVIEELRGQLDEKLKAAHELADKAEADARDLTAEERTTIKSLIDEATPIRKRLDEAKGDRDLLDTVKQLSGGSEQKQWTAPGQWVASQPSKSLGEKFADEVDAWLKASYPNGRMPETAKGISSPPFGFRGFKDLITGLSTTSAGALITPADLGLRDSGGFMRPLTLRDIVTNGQTSGDTVEFVRITDFTNAAESVPEATAASGTSGTKPESALAMERVNETVKTIAHWFPVTKRALADAGQIRTLVDQFGRYGLEEELEDQMVNGNGSDDFVGIANTPNIQPQSWSTDLLTTTRKARTKVRTVGRAIPTAYLLHPADWERFDLLTNDTQGNFYFGGPREMGQPRLWGLPVVESEAVTEGTGYVGDFRQCVLWDREQASVSVSDSHSDFFIRNLVAILFELRAAFGIFRPQAIVEMDLTA